MGVGTRLSDCDTKEQDTESRKKLTAGGAARRLFAAALS
jgi:hypothetical protein